jgi:hypothetical protein
MSTTYTYTGQPLNEFQLISNLNPTSPFQGGSVSFSFVSTAALAANLTAASGIFGSTTPTYSVPISSWSFSGGPYTASGTGQNGFLAGPQFVVFNTNSSGGITGWFIEIWSPTTAGSDCLTLVLNNIRTLEWGPVGPPDNHSAGAGPDYIQYNPYASGTGCLNASAPTVGSWAVT